MRRRASISLSALAFVALWPALARAQACCAGAAVITPARVGPHDVALVGAQFQASGVYGSYSSDGNYRASPAGASELDFEQDLFAAYKPLERIQFSLLVPFLETRRVVHGTREFGGGVGDVNVGARFDLIRAQEFKYVPGMALLGGLTLPTGKPPDSASKPLATDATGLGSFQGVVGLALEHIEGPWLFNVTGLLAKRAPHSAYGVRETLGAQYTALAAAGYSFDNGFALAVMGSYMTEGNATINDQTSPESGRRLVTFRALALVPIVVPTFLLQGSVFTNPPIDNWGKSEPASNGLSVAIVRTWS